MTFSPVPAQYSVSRLVIGRRTEPGFPPYLRLVHTARAGHVPPVPPAPHSYQETTTLSPFLTCANSSAIAPSSRTLTQPCEAPAYPVAAKSDE